MKLNSKLNWFLDFLPTSSYWYFVCNFRCFLDGVMHQVVVNDSYILQVQASCKTLTSCGLAILIGSYEGSQSNELGDWNFRLIGLELLVLWVSLQEDVLIVESYLWSSLHYEGIVFCALFVLIMIWSVMFHIIKCVFFQDRKYLYVDIE